jgi:hypothetical protein
LRLVATTEGHGEAGTPLGVAGHVEDGDIVRALRPIEAVEPARDADIAFICQKHVVHRDFPVAIGHDELNPARDVAGDELDQRIA